MAERKAADAWHAWLAEHQNEVHADAIMSLRCPLQQAGAVRCQLEAVREAVERQLGQAGPPHSYAHDIHLPNCAACRALKALRAALSDTSECPHKAERLRPWMAYLHKTTCASLHGESGPPPRCTCGLDEALLVEAEKRK